MIIHILFYIHTLIADTDIEWIDSFYIQIIKNKVIF